jgi:hypothetical protein
MKSLLTALAGIALLALAAPVSAQPYPASAPPMQPQTPVYRTAAPNWMQDDRSSSDHPIHMPSDFGADNLNAQYRNGISVPPGQGFPAGGR